MAVFDVVLFGATGVTGGNALPYLADRAAETGIRWAIAGRNPQKLHQLVSKLPLAGAPEVLEADLEDRASLEEMARAAAVVINAVGPYRTSADPVIAACIAGGADYLDMTGESDVVAELLRRYDAPARAAGVRIVQAAGYESLPADLATALAGVMAGRRGARLHSVELVATIQLPPGLPRPSDGVSGGTYASTVDAVRSGGIEQLTDPACLIDDPREAEVVRRSSPYGVLPHRSGTQVLVPMIPSPFSNPPVVHRTQSVLRAEGAGAVEQFRYREGVALAEGLLSIPLGVLVGTPMTAAMTGARILGKLAPQSLRDGVATAMAAVGPDPGRGPQPDRLEGWRWRMTVVATGDDGEQDRVVVDADGHPGYLTTSRIIAEAALLLADDDARLPDRRGHLTPALALGTDELARFARAGLRFAAG